jgi:hypothetical protein
MAFEGPNTLEAIESNIPNGFHDAALYEIGLDLEKREMTLVLGADVSSTEGDGRIAYRRCRVLISGVAFVQMDPLRDARKAGDEYWSQIDSGVLEGKRLKEVYPSPLPEGSFAYWFFMNETNGFIYLVAREAKFEWLA